MAKWGNFVGNVLLNRDKKPHQLTPGLSSSSSSSSSSGLDLSSAMAIILTPDVPIAQIPTGGASPLPEDIVRLVLGHSLLSFQGILVVPGVVNSDYTEKLKFWSCHLLKLQINKGQRIAQLLLLPYYQTENPWLLKLGAPEDLDLAFWVQKIAASMPLIDFFKFKDIKCHGC